MVVTKAVEGGNRLGCVFFPIVVYKGEALIQKSILMFSSMDRAFYLDWEGITLWWVSNLKGIQDTLHWPVILSLARKILAICPKGLNSSWQE